MRLDRYTGQEPKFKVLRRQPDGTYSEVPAFDCFVMKRQDINTPDGLMAYADAALRHGDQELNADMMRLAYEWLEGPHKQPD